MELQEEFNTPTTQYYIAGILIAMATGSFVLPGELLDSNILPSHPTNPLKLGPGLRHIPPNTITPTVAGQLYTDKRKNAVWVESNGGRVRWHRDMFS
jgi:hypothetical protein